MKQHWLKTTGLACTSLGLAIVATAGVRVGAQPLLGQVLGESTQLAQALPAGSSFLPSGNTGGAAVLSPLFQVNIPAVFTDTATILSLIVEEESVFNGQARFVDEVILENGINLGGDVTADGSDIDVGSGTVTASNLVYSVLAGSGITVSGDQDITITNGDRGSAQKIFGKVKVGSDTAEAGSNTDTFEFASGDGISLSLNTSDKKLTITGANQSGWYKASSSNVVLLSSTDNVGIGTSSPTNKLEIDSGTDGASGVSFTRITSSTAAGVGGGKVLSVDSGGKIILVQDQTGDSATPSAEAILPSATSGMTLYFNGLNWAASNNLFHDGGSVGISTTSPTSRFQVNTNLASKIGAIIQGYTSQTANLQEWRDSTGSILSYIDASGVFNGSANVSGSLNPGLSTGSVLFQGASGIAQDNSNFFWDDASNLLGIGTATPARTVDIVAPASSAFRITRNTSANMFLELRTGDFGAGNGALIYAPNLAYTSNGTSPLVTFTGSGTVGIGTTGPLEMLHVTSSGGDSAYFEGDVKIGLDGANAGGNPAGYLHITSNWGDDSKPAIHIGSGTYGWNQYYNTSGDLVLNREVSSTETNVLTMLRASGNVGIGTTTPGSLLHIESVTTDPTITIQNKVNPGVATNNFLKVLNGAGTERVRFSYDQQNVVFGIAVGTTVTSPHLAINNSGFVGIGTTSPSTELEISKTSAGTTLSLTGFDQTVGEKSISKIAFKDTGASSGTTQFASIDLRADAQQTANLGDLAFYIKNGSSDANPSEVMRIRSGSFAYGTGGALGIGTTAPASKVSILATRNINAAGVTAFNVLPHTANLTGVDGSTYATIYAAQVGAMTLTGNTTSQTVTNAAGLVVSPAIKSTNATVTNSHGLLVPATAVSTATNAYGMTINAPTGATNNYAAAFLGGNVGVGTTSPGTLLHLYASGDPQLSIQTSSNGNPSLKLTTDGWNWTLQNSRVNQRFDIIGASATRLSIDDNTGNVGIGTTISSATDSVLGTMAGIFVQGSSTNPGYVVSRRNVSTVANGTGFASVLNNSAGTATAYSYFNGLILNNTAGSEAGALAFYTKKAGTLTEQMRVDNNGNVGIGTTSPTALLHINGGYGSNDALTVNQTLGGNILSASASGATRMVLTNSGFLGIGTTTPREMLHSNGGLAVMGAADGCDGLGCVTLSTESGYGRLQSWGGIELAINSAGNNVGIGTTDPASPLHVYGSTTYPLIVQNGSTGRVYIGSTTNENLIASTNSTGGSYKALAFETKSGYSMYLNTAGLVGFGTTSPLATLDVRAQSGTIAIASVSGATSHAALVVDNSGVGDIFTASSSGENRLVVKQSGNVGIGTTNPGTYKLNVAGHIVANSTGDGGKLSSTRDGSYEIYLKTTNGDTSLLHTQAGFWIEEPNAYKILSYNSGIAQPIITFNENSQNFDTWIKGTTTTVFYGDASTGNVGIGTTNPGEKLHVYGSSGASGATPVSIRIDSSTNSQAWTANSVFGKIDAFLSGDGSGGGTSEARTRIASVVEDTTATDIGLSFYTSDGDLVTKLNERMRLTSGGNLGIGTTAPVSKQHIFTTGTSSQYLTMELQDSGQAYENTIRLRKTNSNGTAVTSSLLGGLDFQGSNSSGGIFTGASIQGNSESIVGATYGRGNLQFLTSDGTAAPTARITINNGGYVGIGTTGPTEKLEVNGNVLLANNSILSWKDGGGASHPHITSSNYDLSFGVLSGQTQMYLSSGGNLGLGTTTFGTSAAKVFAIAGSTAPSTSITDGVQLFAVDVTGSHELQVRDEAGNVTTLSPHNFSQIEDGKSEDLAWSFYSERNGLAINADMTKALRVIEKLSGEKLVYIKNLTNGQDLSEFYADQAQNEVVTDTAQWLTKAELSPLASWSSELWTFIGKVVFEKPVEFLAAVTFKGRVYFADKDAAGQIIMKPGDTEAEVPFEQAFVAPPAVTLTTQNSFVPVTVTEVTQRSFRVSIESPQSTELKITWTALAVETLRTTEGKTTTVSPVVSPQPTQTPIPSPSPEVAGATTEETAVASPSASPSHTPTE